MAATATSVVGLLASGRGCGPLLAISILRARTPSQPGVVMENPRLARLQQHGVPPQEAAPEEPDPLDRGTPWERGDDSAIADYELIMIRRSASNMRAIGLGSRKGH